MLSAPMLSQTGLSSVETAVIDSSQEEILLWEEEELLNPNYQHLEQDLLVIPEIDRAEAFFYRGLNEDMRFKKKEMHSVFFIYFLIMFALIGLVLSWFPDFMSNISRSFGNFRLARIYFEEEDYGDWKPGFMLHLVHLMVGGAILFFLLQLSQFMPEQPVAYILLGSFLVASGLFLLRYLFLQLFAKVFPAGRYFRFFLFNQVVLQMMMGILCLPFLVFYVYTSLLPSEWFGMMILAIVVCFFAYLLYRGLYIAGNFIRIRPFHFILYLCAFEIAPLVLLYGLYRELVL